MRLTNDYQQFDRVNFIDTATIQTAADAIKQQQKAPEGTKYAFKDLDDEIKKISTSFPEEPGQTKVIFVINNHIYSIITGTSGSKFYPPYIDKSVFPIRGWSLSYPYEESKAPLVPLIPSSPLIIPQTTTVYYAVFTAPFIKDFLDNPRQISNTLLLFDRKKLDVNTFINYQVYLDGQLLKDTDYNIKEKTAVKPILGVSIKDNKLFIADEQNSSFIRKYKINFYKGMDKLFEIKTEKKENIDLIFCDLPSNNYYDIEVIPYEGTFPGPATLLSNQLIFTYIKTIKFRSQIRVNKDLYFPVQFKSDGIIFSGIKIKNSLKTIYYVNKDLGNQKVYSISRGWRKTNYRTIENLQVSTIAESDQEDYQKWIFENQEEA